MKDKYNQIMKKVAKRAKEIAISYKGNNIVGLQDFDKAIEELPKKDRDTIHLYEDKQNIKFMQQYAKKPNNDITNNSFLLLTQAIIESAIAENDEEFFKSKYGEMVVDMYNTALTIHKSYDYNITAELLLEKMRKNAIKIKGEKEDA